MATWAFLFSSPYGDMWHFFMQHYGFMRIYDVKRHKPSRLSGRLDWLLTATCFTYIVAL